MKRFLLMLVGIMVLVTGGFFVITSTLSTVRQAGQDFDQDGVDDGVDNCPEVQNPMQSDTDADGRGDACDSEPGVPDGQAAFMVGAILTIIGFVWITILAVLLRGT